MAGHNKRSCKERPATKAQSSQSELNGKESNHSKPNEKEPGPTECNLTEIGLIETNVADPSPVDPSPADPSLAGLTPLELVIPVEAIQNEPMNKKPRRAARCSYCNETSHTRPKCNNPGSCPSFEIVFKFVLPLRS
ncbi:hypothetical protein M9H77_25586 [Catharanthus roseus]|uniref:Uncharacterized protein n=1 Tax=Catharanthus roseus TaxID=4058 RepID=A0ACC0A9W8_CATRO|nr:hypothetical protein M9H77_25586 [Catharanthus roseus]